MRSDCGRTYEVIIDYLDLEQATAFQGVAKNSQLTGKASLTELLANVPIAHTLNG